MFKKRLHSDDQVSTAVVALPGAIFAVCISPSQLLLFELLQRSIEFTQYLCENYITELKNRKFIISNSRKGNPYDNAFAERLMRTLKQQEVYLAKYETYLDVVEQLPQFIEDVYNEKRVHSAIGYLTPNELEEMEKQHKDVSRFELEV